MAESKRMMEKEVDFMKKKGAPKSMIKHEMAEAKSAKKPKKFLAGGITGGPTYTPPSSRTFGENARMAKDLRSQLAATKAQKGAMSAADYQNAMGNLRTQLSDVRARQNIGRSDPVLAARMAEFKPLSQQAQALRSQIAAQKAAPSAKGAAQRATMQDLRGQLGALRTQLAPMRTGISTFTKPGMKKGGEVKGNASGSSIDGRAVKGKTKTRYI